MSKTSITRKNEKKFVSHIDALKYYRVPSLEYVFKRSISDSDDKHFTVTNYKDRYRCEGHNVHLCTLDLPKGALVKDRKSGELISSPEFAFLQVASKLEIEQVILLGLLMCSHPPGQPHKAITTKEKLVEFLKRTKKHWGHRKASRAAKYLINGLNSVTECIAYMKNSLPPLLGGRSLKGGIPNLKIELDIGHIEELGQDEMFPDMVYEDKKKGVKVVYEYDSYTYHNNATSFGNDNKRSQILEDLGYTVINMTTIQLYETKDYESFVKRLAKQLKQRIQIRISEKDFQKAYKKIHDLLPS